MPFRFTNTPGIPVLRNMLNQFVFVYLEPVRQVLLSLLQYQLFVKVEKCEFHQFTGSFLGFVSETNSYVP